MTLSLLPCCCAVTYTQGQVVSLKVRFTANHGGRFAFRLCPRSTGPWTQDCFNNPAHALTRCAGFAVLRYVCMRHHLKYLAGPAMCEQIACVVQSSMCCLLC
jgi:hypothetical protein